MNTKTSFLQLKNLLLVALIALATSCSKTESNPNNPGGGSATMTAFSFLQAGNNIPVSSTATISGTSATIFLPPGTAANALIGTFTLSSGATASVGGVAQTSGVTVNDFTQSIQYTITGADGSTQPFTVFLITDINQIDEQVGSFMLKYNIPGMTIAITQDNRLVYSKAYGYADTANQKLATTSSLFRLASDSKQFTSVAIMRLLDQGKINMTDKVFGPGAILGTTYGAQPYNPGVTDITVSDLLHHTSGGWGADGDQYNNYNDPMFSNLSMNNQELINWTLNNMPLDTLPNTTFNYSNFGFFLLARVVEKIYGQPYAKAVQDLVLTPCGITDMQIAGNTMADSAHNEVVYYSQEQQVPYSGLNIHRADGCAGWIASSVDLAKFMTHINQYSPTTDLLSANAFKVMTSNTPASPGYACGWGINNNGAVYAHEGALPGNSSDQAFMTKLISSSNPGNFTYSMVVNTRNLGNNYGWDLDNIFWAAIPTMNAWPTYDLFTAQQ